MLFPVGNEVPETQLPSFLPVALERAGPGGRRGLLRREVGQRLPWAQRGAVPSGGPCLPCPTSIWGAKPGNLIDEAPPAMDSAARDKTQPALPTGLEWPEQERAEQLARGAALKWASGIFYRPEQLARLGQYRNREVQRTCSLEARIKSVVQSYLEGVKTGVWQLAQALEAVQGAREALGQARGLLRDMAEAAQTLEPLREQVVEHKQLQALSQLLPRLRAVPAAVAHTQTLIDAQRLLEAYVSLRELEQLQEETPEMMGSLELGPEADVSDLEPLLTLENIEQLEATFVAKVQAKVAQWLQKALDGEVVEWGREQEPDTDLSGFYHSPLPAIVLQILEENIRVTRIVSVSLEQRVHGMALSELSAFLRSFTDALIRFSRDHLRGEAVVPHYVPYLLATLNHQLALSPNGWFPESWLRWRQSWTSCRRGSVAWCWRRCWRSYRRGFRGRWGWEEEIQRMHGGLCRGMLGLNRRSNYVSKLRSQPLFAALPSRRWLSSPELLDDVCKRTARFCQNFQHVRNPAVQLLLVEAERTVVLQYLSALMQGRLVCRGADERTQAAERMQHDAAQLQELFLGLGLEESVQCVPVLLALKELLNLRDPTLLGLEVAGLRQQFPDVRCEDGPGREETQERLGGANAPVTPQRGSRLRPPGPARRRVPRAAPGRTQLSAGRPAALAPSWSPSTFQPRANTCTLAGLLLPLRVLCLTPDCPQNKVTSPYA
ncbi:exocyst complex component 3-like protein isoform X9 [Bos javanicus]|uniref:exocyst complex component 3-like protein isoform X9 n=1 Tax=Bos javanicus TaxID=9906 RepID=UPI002AA89AE4|nr:exocyst complex component 3-like protein isoform X9 [Bos javanicus]